MCEVTKMDKARNNNITRGTTNVIAILKKMEGRKLQWYGEVRRREESYVGIRVLGMVVPGERTRHRPRQK